MGRLGKNVKGFIYPCTDRYHGCVEFSRKTVFLEPVLMEQTAEIYPVDFKLQLLSL
jgi:hypothetical protein